MLFDFFGDHSDEESALRTLVVLNWWLDAKLGLNQLFSPVVSMSKSADLFLESLGTHKSEHLEPVILVHARTAHGQPNLLINLRAQHRQEEQWEVGTRLHQPHIYCLEPERVTESQLDLLAFPDSDEMHLHSLVFQENLALHWSFEELGSKVGFYHLMELVSFDRVRDCTE